MKNYKQTDKRWSSLPCCDSDMYISGCGPVAISDLVNLKPPTVLKWMENTSCFANGGTLWKAIPKVMEHYGYSCNQVNYGSLYGEIGSPAFDELKKSIQSGYAGILLMGNGYWSTKSGHFIVIAGYSKKHDLYLVYDPDSRRRDGYHPWEDFAGAIKVCYTTDVKAKKSLSDLYYLLRYFLNIIRFKKGV